MVCGAHFVGMTRVERTCKVCGSHYHPRLADVQRGKATYCSRSCLYLGRSKPSDRLLASVSNNREFSDSVNIRSEKYGLILSLSDLDWFLDYPGGWYSGIASGKAFYIQSTRDRIRLHILLMNRPDGMTVDHINGNTIDNRRGNLRVVSRRLNAKNHGGVAGTTSKYVGVHWSKSVHRWVAQVKDTDGTTLHLGCFWEEQDAALIRDAASYKLHGEFSRLNFPDIIITSSLFTERVQRRIDRARAGVMARRIAA